MLVNVTPEEIKAQYEIKHGHPMQQEDYDAFLRMTDKYSVTSYDNGLEYIGSEIETLGYLLLLKRGR